MIAYETAAPGAPLVMKESRTPEPQGSEILMKMLACGVCHSDIHLHDGVFNLGNDKHLAVGRPGLVLGHEIFGEIIAIGPDATNVRVGDRRVVYPWIGCGQCASCRRGEEHLCTPGRGLGTMVQGGFADHVLVPHSRYLFDKGDVPDALASTYACSGLTAYSALKKLSDRVAGDEVLIIGAGGVGMMAVQIALSMGIDPLVADIDPLKLAAAKALGVSRVFDSADRNQAKEIKKLSDGGVYAALDFVGAEASTGFGLSCLRKGGRLVIVGLYGGALNIPLPFIPMNARIIQGSYVGSLQEMAELMALVRAGKIAPIRIEERPLAQVTQALADLKAGKIQGRIVLRGL
ncbi:MAG: alcohol dehydrogenase [Gammaproteobacteria bacterium]|nr:alcohol dehydrogenase [Gammaproteobacteria bacterium]MDP2141717.1 alcohol dehydrogenase [Gammaproteobacteria bacterium]MDP2347952.1 alcohol dehydrogenase [Gammaproteobacteria bacterium]